MSDGILDVTIAVLNDSGDPVNDVLYPTTIPVDPGQTISVGLALPDPEWLRCTLTWVGQTGDLRASSCAWRNLDQADVACLELW
jgi:hypothetical protein